MIYANAIGSFFQPLLKGVADVLAWLYSLIPNYPVDVALLTVIIMALLTPLTVKSVKGMAAMQAIAPEMKKLQQKYKGPENRALLNEEMMKLYKEHNANPASGCLPLLLTMPAFLILYDVIRGITNTVAKGATMANGAKCVPPHGSTVCADPRYISHTTAMYHDIVAANGQLNSFGMNFAEKLWPFSHHSSIWAAIPYLLLVLGSVGLQYLQMARMNARNPGAAQANPQAAMLQKYMPIIFGVIYINVAALLNVYFIVSNAIRILTQEILFRRGISTPPTLDSKAKPAPAADRTEREIPKAKPSSKVADGDGANGKPAGSPAKAEGKGPAKGGAGGGKPAPKSTTTRARDARGTNGNGSNTPGSGGKAAAAGGGNGTGSNNSSNSEDGAGRTREHPRSKDKRARKAR